MGGWIGWSWRIKSCHYVKLPIERHLASPECGRRCFWQQPANVALKFTERLTGHFFGALSVSLASHVVRVVLSLQDATEVIAALENLEIEQLPSIIPALPQAVYMKSRISFGDANWPSAIPRNNAAVSLTLLAESRIFYIPGDSRNIWTINST